MRVFGSSYSLQCLHSQRDFAGVASGVHSAIHGKIRPGNVRGLRTGDKRHHRGDLIHTPVTIERCGGLLRHRPITRGGIQFRVDRTRLDVVDRDAPAPYLSGKRLSEHLDGSFRGRVGTSPGATARSPTAEPIMMMRPPSFMCFSAACVVASTPRRLMSITRSISSSVVSSNGFGMAVPALLTSTSSRPNVATVFSTALLTASTSAASAWIATAFPPLCSMALTTAEAALASLAYVMATLAPSLARRFAIAAPMPREPPVTSATFSVNLDM